MDENKKEIWRRRLELGKAIFSSANEIGARVVPMVMFDKRFTTTEGYLSSFEGHLYKNQTDFPSLKEREKISFKSGSNKLNAYLYRCDMPIGLVMVVHGMMSLADSNIAIVEDYFLRNSFDVMAIDLTSSGESQGRAIKGLEQGAIDVSNAIAYINSKPSLAKLPLFLIGHSWGGYSVCASLYFDQSPVAVASLSGFINPIEEMLGIPKVNMGALGIIPEASREELEDSIMERSGQIGFLGANDGIEKAKNTKIMLIHGDLDRTVPYKLTSILTQYKGRRRVEKVVLKGKKHGNVFYSKEAIQYAEPIFEKQKQLASKYKKWDRVPEAEVEAFYASIDKEKTSVIDEGLFAKIKDFFIKSL